MTPGSTGHGETAAGDGQCPGDHMGDFPVRLAALWRKQLFLSSFLTWPCVCQSPARRGRSASAGCCSPEANLGCFWETWHAESCGFLLTICPPPSPSEGGGASCLSSGYLGSRMGLSHLTGFIEKQGLGETQVNSCAADSLSPEDSPAILALPRPGSLYVRLYSH